VKSAAAQAGSGSESLQPWCTWKVVDAVPIRNAGWIGENKVYAWSAARKLYIHDIQKQADECPVQVFDMVSVRFLPPPFSAGAIYSSVWKHADATEYLPCVYRSKAFDHRYLLSNQAPVWDLCFLGESGRLLTCDENGEIFCTVVDWLKLKRSFAAIGMGLLSNRVTHKCEREGDLDDCRQAGCEIRVTFAEDKTLTNLKEKQRLKSMPLGGIYRIDAIELNGKLVIAAGGKSGFLFTMMQN